MWVVRLLVDEMAANSRSTYTLANPPEFLNCRSALPSHLKLPGSGQSQICVNNVEFSHAANETEFRSP